MPKHASRLTQHTLKRPLKHPKKSHFTRNFMWAAGFLLTGCLFFFIYLWNYLADYENTLPSKLSEEILTAYKNGDTNVLKSYCVTLPEALQEDLAFHQYLIQLFQDGTPYYYESSEQEESSTITYSFNTGSAESDETFAKLVVHKTADVSKFGFPLYEIQSLNQYVLHEYTLHAAPGCTFYVRGKPLSSEYLAAEEAVAACFTEAGFGPFSKRTYVLPDYMISDSLTALDNLNNPCRITWNDTHTVCTASAVLPDDTRQELAVFAIKAAKEYAVFATIKNASKSALQSFLYPGTSFSQTVKTYDNDWGISKTADDFESVSVSEATLYDRNLFSCEVSFDYVVTQGSATKRFLLSFTLYCTNENGAFQLVHLESNTAD